MLTECTSSRGNRDRCWHRVTGGQEGVCERVWAQTIKSPLDLIVENEATTTEVHGTTLRQNEMPTIEAIEIGIDEKPPAPNPIETKIHIAGRSGTTRVPGTLRSRQLAGRRISEHPGSVERDAITTNSVGDSAEGEFPLVNRNRTLRTTRGYSRTRGA